MPKVLVILQNAYGTTAKRRRQLRNEALWRQGLAAPHPAWRALSNERAAQIREELGALLGASA